MQIYITKSGNQTGPFTEEQTRSMVSAGSISHDDLAWTEGAADWQPLGSLLGISQPPSIPDPPVLLSHDSSVVIIGPKGVGGWLVIFCILLTIISPLIVVAQLVSTWIQSESAFVRFPTIKTIMLWESFGSIVLLVYGFIVGCIIWSGNLQGRSIARRFLLIRLFGFIGIELVGLVMMRGLPGEVVSGGVGGVVGAVFKAVVSFLVWWFYFKISRRVRNTYGDERT